LAPVLAIALSCLSCARDDSKPEVGHRAPDFRLVAVNGKAVRLRDLEGKVVFVNIWATWCPPCRQEMPSMVTFYEMFKDEGVTILGVSEDHDPEVVKAFVKKYQIPFPVLLDRDKIVFKLYRATGVPETHLINERGVIEASWIGPFDWTGPRILNSVRTLLTR
jgi:peroxiredoxin